MDISVALFVVLMGAAVVVGVGAGALLHRWRASRDTTVEREHARTTASLRAQLAQAKSAAEREAEQRSALSDELDAANAAAEATAQSLEETAEALQIALDRLETTEREAAVLRANFRDVVGLESENTTLRAIAARVRDLEARLAERDAAPQVIDLREDATRRAG